MAGSLQYLPLYPDPRGYPILQAIVADLKTKGMSSATEVILTGCSGEYISAALADVLDIIAYSWRVGCLSAC